ncbi:hypothetical protein F2Q69_00015860 [Brassica cretica]|uniref:Uncharacterized protein n=1 Tax=Brassica cretica TaxID=69181 RepID=A0A8S9R0L2_BRACR|nr:hypothetical protein F2Q69_00015860 [Brassica cretica]
MKRHHLRRRTLTSSHGDSNFFPSSPAKNIVIISDEAHRFSNDAISLKRTTINPRSCSGKDKALLCLLSNKVKVLRSCWSSNQRLLNCGNTRKVTLWEIQYLIRMFVFKSVIEMSLLVKLCEDINTTENSVPEILAMPELKYPIRSEPKPRVTINQYSSATYIKTFSVFSSQKS